MKCELNIVMTFELVRNQSLGAGKLCTQVEAIAHGITSSLEKVSLLQTKWQTGLIQLTLIKRATY